MDGLPVLLLLVLVEWLNGRLATGSENNRFSGLLVARDDLHHSQGERRFLLRAR